jgi:tetratricopeptide (TPR) repeat protein
MQEKLIGALIKIERLKQQRKQSEICKDICVPSYLSKIEHGQVKAENEIITKLFAKLGIDYIEDEEFIDESSKNIKKYFKQLNYNMDTNETYERLEVNTKKLSYSVFAIDWLIIQAYEKDMSLDLLYELKDVMTPVQSAYYTIKFALDKKVPIDLQFKFVESCEALRNSYGLLTLCQYYMIYGDYTSIHGLENRVTVMAIEEGNTYRLAEYLTYKGSAYACLNQHQMMMTYYERSIMILQNTGWTNHLKNIYYNAGATYINMKDYQLALTYLNKVSVDDEDSSFQLLHKKAVANIRMGKVEEGKKFLKIIKNKYLSKETICLADKLKYEEACFECQDGFVNDPKYLMLLEKLITELKKEYHFGHLFFYSDMIVETYKKHRKYKKALEFEAGISYKLVNTII